MAASEEVTALGRLEGMLEVFAKDYGIDWSITADTGHMCMWSFMVRVTPVPNAPGIADESRVFYVAGQVDPEGGAAEIYGQVKYYLGSKLAGDIAEVETRGSR